MMATFEVWSYFMVPVFGVFVLMFLLHVDSPLHRRRPCQMIPSAWVVRALVVERKGRDAIHLS